MRAARTFPRLFIFDMAGTTVRDDGQVKAAFSEALHGHGIDVTDEQIARVRGASKKEAIRDFVGEGDDRESRARDVYVEFRTLLARRYSGGGAQAMQGADATFAWVRSQGAQVALNTGFDREVTDLLIDALGWRVGIVDAIVCGDDVERGRPAPDLILRAMRLTGVTNPDDVANVGDTILDLQAGAAAGVGFNVGVLSGAHERARLQQQPHTHLIESVRELSDIWKA